MSKMPKQYKSEMDHDRFVFWTLLALIFIGITAIIILAITIK